MLKRAAKERQRFKHRACQAANCTAVVLPPRAHATFHAPHTQALQIAAMNEDARLIRKHDDHRRSSGTLNDNGRCARAFWALCACTTVTLAVVITLLIILLPRTPPHAIVPVVPTPTGSGTPPPPGPAGPDGQVFTYVGTWSCVTAYHVREVVNGSDGRHYAAQITTSGVDPVTCVPCAQWQLVAERGPTGGDGPAGVTGLPGTSCVYMYA